MSFVHLHNHTQYSILDGACKIKDLMKTCKEYEMNSVAITDHGNLFGLVEFNKSAKSFGIKPLFGMEIYLVDHNFDDPLSKDDKRYHLILLVKDRIGYKNIIKIATEAFINGFYYKPRINKAFLEKHSKGLIASSACVQGEIPLKLLTNEKNKAYQVLDYYKSLFDDFYIELQDHGLEDEKKVNPLLIEMAKKTNTPLIVSNDCHYLKKEDYASHEVLLSIQTNAKLSDENRFSIKTDQLYFKNEKEMRTLFPELESAYDNTVKISEMIDFSFDKFYNSYLLPKMQIPSEYKSEKDYLYSLIEEKKRKRYPEITQEIEDRINYELSVISKMNFENYFLIVKDFIDTARKNNIPVGPGRGSAAGSIISYILEITQVDPLKYKLLFERFLNPERIGMPDIDIDFCAKNRDKIVNYLIEKYGRENVSQIVTYSSLKAKSAIKDVARVLELPPSEANEITKKLPGGPADINLSNIKENLKSFYDFMNSNEKYKEILKHSIFAQGLIRQISVHACGILICSSKLNENIPLATAKSKNKTDKVVLSQYEGKWLDDLKLLKMDVLGLKTLTIISNTINLVKKTKNLDIDINNLPLDDKNVYELFSQGKTNGVFQFESEGMKSNLIALKPNVFDDIISMVALYRPGPMDHIPNFINRKNGLEEVKYEHPLMEKHLKETYGVTVYQEQVMNLSIELADFSGAEADTLRKAMGKKNIDQMNTLKIKFLDGSKKKGVSEKVANDIWNNWEKFAEYAFNKSHAVSYGLLAYQTAYLKKYFPVEFMAVLLSLENNPDKISFYLAECTDMKIEVKLPDINISEGDYTVINKAISFGLSGIKGVGIAAVNAILSARKNKGTFKNLFDFCEKVNLSCVNKSVIEALICAGAMDNLPLNRATKFLNIERAIEYGNNKQKEKNSLQPSLFEDDFLIMPKIISGENWTKLETLEKEKTSLGFYISGHPLNSYKHEITYFTNLTTKSYRENFSIDKQIHLIGILNDQKEKFSKKKKPFGILKMEDLYSNFEISLFGKNYEEYKDILKKNKVYYIMGNISNYENKKIDNEIINNPENLENTEENNEDTYKPLKISANRIFEIEKISEILLGEIVAELPFKTIKDNTLADKLNNICLSNKGNFLLIYKINFDNGEIITLKSSHKVFPNNAFYKQILQLTEKITIKVYDI